MDKTKHLKTKYSLARYSLIKRCTGDELRFYLYVKLYAINKNSAFPSQKAFKRDLDWSKYTTNRIVKSLEEKKRLKVKRSIGKNNVYDITWYDRCNEKVSSQETFTTSGRETLTTSRRETLTQTIKNKTIKKELVEEKLTPSQEMKLFLTNKEEPKRIAQAISKKSNLPYEQVLLELENFTGYWSELNKSGTKQRWQLEKTFELKRRLGTWFKNKDKFGNKKKPYFRDMRIVEKNNKKFCVPNDGGSWLEFCGEESEIIYK